jgi:Domain of unknown function (DUF4383)
LATSATGVRDGAPQPRRGVDDREMTPAQWYCAMAGLSLLLAGILGFIADSGFDTGNGIQGDKLIVFEVNGWHNLVHILSGLLLLSVFRRRGPAKTVALAFALVYGVVTVIGLIDGSDVLGIIPVNAADNVLHIALTALGLFTGLTSRGEYRDSDRTTAGRTQQPAVSDLDRGERVR